MRIPLSRYLPAHRSLQVRSLGARRHPCAQQRVRLPPRVSVGAAHRMALPTVARRVVDGQPYSTVSKRCHVPDDFGAEGGTPLSNANELMAQIDGGTEPTLEFIFVEPCKTTRTDGFMAKFFRYCYGYGHGSLRYTRANGEAHVMTLCNPFAIYDKERQPPTPKSSSIKDALYQKRDPDKTYTKKLVCLMSAVDYFFSCKKESFIKEEQHGVYNREFTCLRLSHVTSEQVEILHKSFQELQSRWDRGNELEYSLTPLHSYIGFFKHKFGAPHPGNCAEWISRALLKAGIVGKVRPFPKMTLLDLAREAQRRGKPYRICTLPRVEHAKWHYDYDMFEKKRNDGSWVHWMHWRATYKYWDLQEYAHSVLTVSKDSTEGMIEKRNPKPLIPNAVEDILLRLPIEPVSVAFLFAAIMVHSPLSFLALMAVSYAACSASGHFIIFDCFVMQLTLLPFYAVVGAAAWGLSLVGMTISPWTFVVMVVASHWVGWSGGYWCKGTIG